MDQTFYERKPILPLLLSMAAPMILSMLVNSLYNIIDSIFVAQISEDAMTALSLVFPIQNFVNSVAVGFGIGINVMIAFVSVPETSFMRTKLLHRDSSSPLFTESF